MRALQGARDALLQTSLINALETLKATEALPELEALFDSPCRKRMSSPTGVVETAGGGSKTLRCRLSGEKLLALGG